MLLRVGLTGGIATGKSAVLSLLSEKGCHGLDADELVHGLMRPGSPLTEAVHRRFGPGVLDPNGGINRKALARIAFDSPALRLELESLVHPEVVNTINARAQQIDSGLAKEGASGILVVDAALLLEQKPEVGLHRVVVTSCSEQEQLERLILRDAMTLMEARQRLAAQMPPAEKRLLADYVIDTSGPLERTALECTRVYDKLRKDLEDLCGGVPIRPKAYLED